MRYTITLSALITSALALVVVPIHPVFPDNTCTTGPSVCSGNAVQSCVNGHTVTTPCVGAEQCIPLPFAGAGVSCTAPPGCNSATAQPYCLYDNSGYRSCVNGQWVLTQCSYNDACYSAPAYRGGQIVTCAPIQECYPNITPPQCESNGVLQTCGSNGQWVYQACQSAYSCGTPPGGNTSTCFLDLTAPCAQGQTDLCWNDNLETCIDDKWYTTNCTAPSGCEPVTVNGNQTYGCVYK